MICIYYDLIISDGYLIIGDSLVVRDFVAFDVIKGTLPYLVCAASGMAFWNSCVSFATDSADEQLRRRPHAKALESFIGESHFETCGVHPVKLAFPRAVLHPVCLFTQRLIGPHNRPLMLYAYERFKRVNDTLQMRLDHLRKYLVADRKQLSPSSLKKLRSAKNALFQELTQSSQFASFRAKLFSSITTRDFSALKFDGAAAAGHPHNIGVKRRDVTLETHDECEKYLQDDDAFNAYLESDVWYTAGRSKMKDRGATDSARIVMYCGFPTMVMVMFYYCRLTSLVMSMPWAGIGDSWMNGGAERFARYFLAEDGIAPIGFRYVSLDIEAYDSSISKAELDILGQLHMELMQSCGVSASYQWRFMALFSRMVTAVVLLPLGILIRVRGGMKSGWPGTSVEDTLNHWLILYGLGVERFKLCADDNFMLVQDSITDDDIRRHYESFGFKLKVIHSSVILGDVDFLSKYVKIDSAGHYYVWRHESENVARLIMPEEQDPQNRVDPDHVVAAQRLIGHLIDNPFNATLTDIIVKALAQLRHEYDLDHIVVDENVRRKHPYRNFDNIPKRIKTNITVSEVQAFYETSVQSLQRQSWPLVWPRQILSNTEYTIHGEGIEFASLFKFCTNRYYKLEAEQNEWAGKRRAYVRNSTSPFGRLSGVTQCYGFHAARCGNAIRRLGYIPENITDLGSHPGAIAEYLSRLDFVRKVTCVTLRPESDESFMPYVRPLSNKITIIEGDAHKHVIGPECDTMINDIDLVTTFRFEDDRETMALNAATCAIRASTVRGSIFWISSCTEAVIARLHQVYLTYGHVQIFRPAYSNPWKPEYCVVAVKKKLERPVSLKRFKRKINFFLEADASFMLQWQDAYYHMMRYATWDQTLICPYQLDRDLQRQFWAMCDCSSLHTRS